MVSQKDIDDKTFVKELSEELNLDIGENNIQKTFRIKARNLPSDKTFPLNVEFHHVDDKYKFLNKFAKGNFVNLSGSSKFQGVKCYPDRTYQQREKYKVLKSEMLVRNQDLIRNNVKTHKWIIRNMNLTKITVFGEEVK